MQCFALGSVAFQQNQVDSTAQCILQFSVAYNALYYTIQSSETGVCLLHCARELGTMTFVCGKMRGSHERVGSSSAGAHRSRERRGYVCSTAHGTRDRRHLLVAK